jgi:hypothetical protein
LVACATRLVGIVRATNTNVNLVMILTPASLEHLWVRGM